MKKVKEITSMLQEYSIPLILGVIFSLVVANINEEAYHHMVEYPLMGEGVKLFGHDFTLHFFFNDIFMVFFFGIAAKEITESVLPGGPLNPIRKAVNPLLGTIGGVVGPVATYLIIAGLLYTGSFAEFFDALGKAFVPGGIYDPEVDKAAAVFRGWGVPTATDIALAWLVAQLIFGKGHPAINFLLLLAVADDAIGLGIIAVFYPDPQHPVHVQWLGLVAAGMAVAYFLRWRGVQAWVPYIVFGGTLSWLGLILASLHPALALVPIVPFLPGPKHDTGLFIDPKDANADGIITQQEHDDAMEHHHGHSPLEQFEHQLKLFVDMGLFFFAFANAGVAFSSINGVTWTVLAALIVGKAIGIFGFSYLGEKLGFSLPEGMGLKHLLVAGVVAGLGLTVALFVAGEAFPGTSPFQGPAKMGAVFSAGAALVAFIMGKAMGVKDGGGVAPEPDGGHH